MTVQTPTSPESTDRANRRVVPFVFFTVFLDLLGFGIMLPLLPLYVDAMGGSAATVGLLFTCFSLTQLIATPVLGRISDRIGRRRVILISLFGNAVSMFAFALASRLVLLPLLFASRIFAGATAGNLAACQAAVSDVTAEDERAAAMGKLAAGINLGFILGPLLGGVLSKYGTYMPPLAAGALAFLDFLGVLFLMPETLRPRSSHAPPPKRASAWDALYSWGVAGVLLLYFFTFLCISNMQVALALLAKVRLDWGPRQVGYLFALYGAISFVMQSVFLGRWAHRIGEIELVLVGSLFTGLGMLVVGQAHQPSTITFGVGLLGVGFGLTLPLLTSLASQVAPPESRGFVLGIAQSSGGLARTIGPLIGGILFVRLAPNAPFIGGAIAALVCIVLGVSLRAKPRAIHPR